MNHTHTLPSNPSLRNLKVQAKSLLKAYREKEPDAVRIFQHIQQGDPVKRGLSDAQFALAMEYGFSCWQELRDYVVTRELLRSNHPVLEEEHILHDMHFDNGKWEDDGEDRIAIFHGGPSSTLISNKAYPGDAIVVEILARPEMESEWGLHFQCLLNAYGSTDELYAASKKDEGLKREPVWRISCGRREKDVWSSILFNQPGSWSRDINCYEGFSSFNGAIDHWYTLKAERLGHMLRLWVNDVPIFEARDPRPVPESVHVWIASVCSNARFRDVKVYHPSAAYISRYSKPIPLFDPYAQRKSILAKYTGKIVREAAICFGDSTKEDGLHYLPDHDGMNRIENDYYCRADCAEGNLPFVAFQIENPEKWNCNNVINLEVDYLDDRKGNLGIFHRTWHFHGTPMPDYAMKGDGENRTLVLSDIRDPLFNGKESAEDDISITTIHPVFPGPAIHQVRVVEEQKPREAYEEVLQAFDREIDRRGDEWTVGHYMFHKALIYRFNLNDSKQADNLMQQASRRWPDCECIRIYKAMCAAKT